jgi:imidazolonepropionase-like amidohydrolase
MTGKTLIGDQLNIELLVEAGFSPVVAIRIATLNGATNLGKDGIIGSIAPGKDAESWCWAATQSRKLKTWRKLNWSLRMASASTQPR